MRKTTPTERALLEQVAEITAERDNLLAEIQLAAPWLAKLGIDWADIRKRRIDLHWSVADAMTGHMHDARSWEYVAPQKQKDRSTDVEDK